MIKKIDQRIEEIEFKLELVNNWLSNIKNTQNSFNTEEALSFAESFERKEKELKLLESERKYLFNCKNALIILQVNVDTINTKLQTKELFEGNEEDNITKLDSYKQKKEALERILKLYLGDQEWN